MKGALGVLEGECDQKELKMVCKFKSDSSVQLRSLRARLGKVQSEYEALRCGRGLYSGLCLIPREWVLGALEARAFELENRIMRCTMGNMAFLPALRTFLREHGEIYTVRHYNYRTRLCDVEGVGRCDRQLIKRINAPTDLDSYVSLSGFSTPRDWWTALRRFVSPGEDMFLFKVVVKR